MHIDEKQMQAALRVLCPLVMQFILTAQDRYKNEKTIASNFYLWIHNDASEYEPFAFKKEKKNPRSIDLDVRVLIRSNKNSTNNIFNHWAFPIQKNKI